MVCPGGHVGPVVGSILCRASAAPSHPLPALVLPPRPLPRLAAGMASPTIVKVFRLSLIHI
eukprot:7090401-Alexandrium_andersonii.AAC.1